uniref:Mitochondrial ATP synthase regulatory component factor B n=1 Tax=Trichobilharzia regenti TaxID=157069 RepID=A0AA85K621_TRIRE|nr:unnamed protein product [Trichobilharzia regenti]
MVCRLGGRVQLVGQTEWIQSYYGIPPSLPNKYDDKFLLQTIDLSGTNIVYEGLEFLPCLTHLQYLRLRRCVHLDDFCLSRVGRIKGLQFLDVSECPSLTSKGLATLGQLKDLRRLIVSGNPQIKDKELVCLLLEDDLPKVYIDGVDYIGQLPSESKEKILQLVAAASTTTTTSDGDTEMSVHQSREKIQEGNEEEEEKVNKEEKVYLIDKA